ncbi:NADP-binding protein [Dacryopinax primogenitus]|uniref:NADP-binding protein n=1 Tax=Dacryopinax primogenitus (strain DJM 731) TaxID=1858805 RepID=M5G8F6_DACPD|nr:NADP-binding protein [Dacryopinax primogenitus]EJU05039.1 NADP-binding protein [Dacryopinax primogenitus]
MPIDLSDASKAALEHIVQSLELTTNMRVLIVGAGGRLGLRVVDHLLTASNEVIAFVRSPSRFLSLLPEPLRTSPSLQVIEGDALSPSSLLSAIRDSNPDAVISSAGVPAFFPWQHSTFPGIGKAVAEACKEALGGGKRVWFVAGMFVCDRPGGGLLMDSTHIYTETRIVLTHLQTKCTDLNWAIVCPSLMYHGSPKPVEAAVNIPPHWPIPGWACRLPLIGFVLVSFATALGYALSYDSVAAWLVQDLEEERWRGKRVALKGL